MLLEFLLAVVSSRGETQSVGNVHNISSTRVAEFDFLLENLDSGCLTCAYTHFAFHLNGFFITLCPKCGISM